MKLKVLNIEGKETGREVDLPADFFGLETPNDHVIYLDVKQYLANRRQGTHKAKERGEVAGSTRKIKKQKGTGGARAGDIKNPLFKGGGRIFGPRPRFYGFKLNKKVKSLAKKSALTYKANEKAVVVVEDFAMDTPQTKEYVRILNNLGASDKRSLLLLNEPNDNIELSGRNIQKASVALSKNINTYDILKSKVLIFTESSLEAFKN